jgi:hypothetical protein
MANNNSSNHLSKSTAVRAGIKDLDKPLKYVSITGLKKGELSIHDGKIWHGFKFKFI